MSVIATLQEMVTRFDPASAEGVNCVIQFKASTPAHVTIKDGTCELTEGEAAGPDVTFTMEDDDLVAMLKGELDGMQAFMTGKLQVEGDMMLGQRMASFFKQ